MWQRRTKQRKQEEHVDAPDEHRSTVARTLSASPEDRVVLSEDEEPAGVSALIEPSVRGPGVWKMGLVVTASALCGGIAVVLWNRRLLTKMREVVPVAHSAQQGRLWEDDL